MEGSSENDVGNYNSIEHKDCFNGNTKLRVTVNVGKDQEESIKHEAEVTNEEGTRCYALIPNESAEETNRSNEPTQTITSSSTVLRKIAVVVSPELNVDGKLYDEVDQMEEQIDQVVEEPECAARHTINGSLHSNSNDLVVSGNHVSPVEEPYHNQSELQISTSQNIETNNSTNETKETLQTQEGQNASIQEYVSTLLEDAFNKNKARTLINSSIFRRLGIASVDESASSFSPDIIAAIVGDVMDGIHKTVLKQLKNKKNSLGSEAGTTSVHVEVQPSSNIANSQQVANGGNITDAYSVPCVNPITLKQENKTTKDTKNLNQTNGNDILNGVSEKGKRKQIPLNIKTGIAKKKAVGMTTTATAATTILTTKTTNGKNIDKVKLDQKKLQKKNVKQENTKEKIIRKDPHNALLNNEKSRSKINVSVTEAYNTANELLEIERILKIFVKGGGIREIVGTNSEMINMEVDPRIVLSTEETTFDKENTVATNNTNQVNNKEEKSDVVRETALIRKKNSENCRITNNARNTTVRTNLANASRVNRNTTTTKNVVQSSKSNREITLRNTGGNTCRANGETTTRTNLVKSSSRIDPLVQVRTNVVNTSRLNRNSPSTNVANTSRMNQSVIVPKAVNTTSMNPNVTIANTGKSVKVTTRTSVETTNTARTNRTAVMNVTNQVGINRNVTAENSMSNTAGINRNTIVSATNAPLRNQPLRNNTANIMNSFRANELSSVENRVNNSISGSPNVPSRIEAEPVSTSDSNSSFNALYHNVTQYHHSLTNSPNFLYLDNSAENIWPFRRVSLVNENRERRRNDSNETNRNHSSSNRNNHSRSLNAIYNETDYFSSNSSDGDEYLGILNRMARARRVEMMRRSYLRQRQGATNEQRRTSGNISCNIANIEDELYQSSSQNNSEDSTDSYYVPRLRPGGETPAEIFARTYEANPGFYHTRRSLSSYTSQEMYERYIQGVPTERVRENVGRDNNTPGNRQNRLDSYHVNPIVRNDRKIHGVQSKYNPQSEGNDCCVICMSDFIVDDTIFILPCIHSFHVTCITKWVQVKRACPICMKRC